MKKGFKRIGAFLLTAVMTLAMNSTVFAANLADGEIGGSSTFATDNPGTQEKDINIKKELTDIMLMRPLSMHRLLVILILLLPELQALA